MIYSESVFVALGIQQAMRMRLIVIFRRPADENKAIRL
jgi:hypothetical protein